MTADKIADNKWDQRGWGTSIPDAINAIQTMRARGGTAGQAGVRKPERCKGVFGKGSGPRTSEIWNTYLELWGGATSAHIPKIPKLTQFWNFRNSCNLNVHAIHKPCIFYEFQKFRNSWFSEFSEFIEYTTRTACNRGQADRPDQPNWQTRAATSPAHKQKVSARSLTAAGEVSEMNIKPDRGIRREEASR